MPEVFVPSPEGADAVLRAAKHRRTVRLSGAATSVLAAVVAVTLLVGPGTSGGSQPDQLTTTTGPSVSPRATPTTAGLRTPAPNRAPGAGAGTAPTPLASVLASAPPPRQSPPPAQHRSTAKRYAPISRTTGTIDVTDLCTDGQTDQSRNFCVRVLDPGTVKRGKTVSIGAEFCVYPTSAAATLDFADTEEVSLDIGGAGTQSTWQAGEGYRYTKPGRSVTVAPGQCLRWSAPWNTRDAEGFVVPPGTYEVDFSLRTKGESAYYPPAWRSITVVD